VLERLKRWLVATVEKEPPSSELAKAAGYCLNHWTALTRFVQDGRLVRAGEKVILSSQRDVAELALARRRGVPRRSIA
jgi:hypothetical protein